MTGAIIGALVGAALSWAASFIVMVVNNRTTIKVIETKLEEQNKKIEKHNNVIERTYRLEEDVKWIKGLLRNSGGEQ